MDQQDSTNDVNTQADTQTAGDSSSDTQQTSGQAATDTAAQSQEEGQQAPETLADGTGKDKSVPFARLEQEIAKRAALEERLKMLDSQQQSGTVQQKQALAPEVQAAREQLKTLLKDLAPELGFVSKEEITRDRTVQQVQSEHTRLATKYNGKDGLPKYDDKAVLDYALKMGFSRPEHLELAYKQMHDAEIMNARIQSALQKTRGVQSEKSNATGSANTGVSNDDLLKAAQSGDQNAITLLIKRKLSKSS